MLTCTGGGADKWSILLTGTTPNKIENYDPASASSSSKPSTTAGPASSAATQSAEPKKGGGSTVGIVVGVIVALVIVGALGFGAFLFLRRKKQREEEARMATDAETFVAGGKADSRPNMWAQDSRMDKLDDRRQSNGSIADNQDYSRKILQVSWAADIDLFIANSFSRCGTQMASKSLCTSHDHQTFSSILLKTHLIEKLYLASHLDAKLKLHLFRKTTLPNQLSFASAFRRSSCRMFL